MANLLSLNDFVKKFPSEEACCEYLVHMRWPDGFKCPYCGNRGAYYIYSRKLFQCTLCRKQTSVTAGTVFHKLRQPLVNLFWAVYLIASSKKGISAMELQRKLGIISYKTAWSLHHKIRLAMASRDEFPLTENVEVEETCITGRRPGKRADNEKGNSHICAAVEIKGCYMGRAYLKNIEHPSDDSLTMFISEKVDPDAKIKTVVPSYTSHNILDKNPLQKIHIIVSNLRMWLLGTYNCLPSKHLQKYLDEFAFRFNRRRYLGNIFDYLLIGCISTHTRTYTELTT